MNLIYLNDISSMELIAKLYRCIFSEYGIDIKEKFKEMRDYICVSHGYKSERYDADLNTSTLFLTVDTEIKKFSSDCILSYDNNHYDLLWTHSNPSFESRDEQKRLHTLLQELSLKYDIPELKADKYITRDVSPRLGQYVVHIIITFACIILGMKGFFIAPSDNLSVILTVGDVK